MQSGQSERIKLMEIETSVDDRHSCLGQRYAWIVRHRQESEACIVLTPFSCNICGES